MTAKLADRSLFQPSSSALTPDSSFPDLVAYWLEDLDLEDRLSTRTRQLYERNMQTLVILVFGNLTLREIGVARCDHFLKQLARQSYNRAKQARVVLRLALGLAVRHEVLPRNPMDHVSRLHRPASTPNALTPAEVNAIRTAIAFWEAGRSPSGPKPDGQLGAIVEVMLGTSARIGEVLAVRRRDVDVTSATPSIRIAGTIVSHWGEPTARQDRPKTAKSRRTVAIPSFTAEAVRRRLTRLDDSSPDASLFCSREGTPLTTNNVRRQLRHVMDLAGITGVTPHMFRRTVATAINEQRASTSPPSCSATPIRRSPSSTTSDAVRWSTRSRPRCSTVCSRRASEPAVNDRSRYWCGRPVAVSVAPETLPTREEGCPRAEMRGRTDRRRVADVGRHPL
ncbi:MAG: site-specific integrase [Frondihabitans sp.]|nr:site-specific integrase [Frondihabitans sp.]